MNKKEEFCKLGLEPYRQYIEEIEEIVPEELQQEVNILLNIAKGYELGIGMAKNLAQAVLIYSQAAEKGCAEAAYHLGELYEKGEGLPQDYQCAIDWYTKAVSLYHPSAEERKKYCEQILQEEQHEAECQFETQQSQQTTKYVFFDTECNGLPFSNQLGVDDTSNWPRMIQLAWLITDEHGNILKRQSHIIYPQGFIITNEVENLTGITTSRAKSEGVNLRTVLNEFMDDLVDAELVIGHNIDFDKHVLGCELYRERLDYDTLLNKKSVCTMQRSTNFCAIPNPNSYYGGYKWPKLEELHRKLFGCNIFGAHDALTDVEATKKCFYELKKKGIL
jgi:DNA polymerase III epsilon subunit-like protein